MRSLASITGTKRLANSRLRAGEWNQAAANTHPETVTVELLNHTDTPIEVFQLIHKHELLHLVFPPREIKGTIRMYPPEFWEAERELCPERRIAWAWLWYNLSDCLKQRPRLEKIDVLGCWKKVWSSPKSSIEDVRGLHGKWEATEEEGGW
jgi:hypothetical protein